MDIFRDANKGWKCPSCGRNNATWISYCDCRMPVIDNDPCLGCSVRQQPNWNGVCG